MKTQRSFGTHSGTFHADEVTACALLLLFNLIDEDKVVRTRDPKLLQTCDYVCDVGGIYDPERKLFDHHQVDYQGSLSSAGMVLEYLQDQKIISQEEYLFFNNMIIIGVDAHDNGRELQAQGVCTFSHVIANFAPIHQDVEEEEHHHAFFEALHFASSHLKRLHERFQYMRACRELVEEAMKANECCLIFEKNIPWFESFFDLGGATHPARFLIMPSGKHWKLRGVPPSYDARMKVRQPLPEEWAGLSEEEFKRVSGIPGAVFCHKGRFISVWETKQDALLALAAIMRKG